MKIQCNGCEAAEAKVLCCADEAALCWECDEKVHAANKLASKHQRVPLLATPSSSLVPKCDICQEASGFFFCLEDRALFCRNCDVAIHTANSHVSAHRRFLLTGVQVGLEPTEPVASFAKEQLNTAGRVSESPCKSFPNESNGMLSSQVSKDGLSKAANKDSDPGFHLAGSSADWPLDDLFGFMEFNQNYGFTEYGSSKADSAKLGSSDGSPPYFSVNEGVDADEFWGRVPEIPCTVPEIVLPSPPTASGLHWQRNLHYPAAENAAFVPDIYPNGYQAKAAVPKRRRYF